MKTIKKYELKSNTTALPKVRIKSSEEAYNYIKQFYSNDIDIFESSFVLLLNRANDTIGYAKISQGGVAGTVIDIKIVLKYVVDTLASGFILCHNHPSGNTNASAQDDLLTCRLKEVCNYMDCDMLDHIIITSDNYYSYADNGKL
jgi:DNA repair protein RadC